MYKVHKGNLPLLHLVVFYRIEAVQRCRAKRQNGLQSIAGIPNYSILWMMAQECD